MSRHVFRFVKHTVLLSAALLNSTPSSVAGDRVHAGRKVATSQTTPAVVTTAAQQPIVLSIGTRKATETSTTKTFVDLRGPDGQIRRFPVEGGPEVIEVRRLVLRPGDSVTIQIAVAR